MGRHALRGAVTAWMALIVLRTVGTAGGSGRLSAFFADVDRMVQHALSPDVPAIPDRRGGGSGSGSSSYITPAQAAAAVKTANGAAAVDSVTSPGGLLDGLPSLGQYVNGGGLSGLGHQ